MSTTPKALADYALRPRLRSLLVPFLVHHNPFYLLSALCMIAGCYALNGALDVRSGDLPRLLILVATLNVYELMLIGLGLWLIRRHRIYRDGRTLLLLEAVFLLDLTFLHAEAATGPLAAGVTVNAVVLALAAVKVALVLSALSGSFPRRAYAFAVCQFALLFALPCLFKWVDANRGGLGLPHLYAAWWAVGMVPVLGIVLAKVMRPDSPLYGVGRDFGRVYTFVPFASLLAHLGMMHWVYKVPFYAGNLSPVLLGLAVIVARRAPTPFLPGPTLAALRTGLPAMAVWLSLASPAPLHWDVPGISRADLTPLLLASAGAYLAAVYTFFLPHARLLVGGAAAACAFVLFGPTLAQMAAGGRWLARAAWGVVPKTAAGWGVTAVGAAFAFLALGAAVSLKGREAVPAGAPPEPGPAPGGPPPEGAGSGA